MKSTVGEGFIFLKVFEVIKCMNNLDLDVLTVNNV